ncbi:MAG TPA: histidine kinase, partial [Candidatus Limnocylindria bacterium]|nr:histidine kinase [Candidatus Limnocylindria bacterium]
MHRALERQIQKFLKGADLSAPEWKAFLAIVDETYQHFDEDRKLISRSLELSSKEFVEVNEKIAKEKAKDDIILE